MNTIALANQQVVVERKSRSAEWWVVFVALVISIIATYIAFKSGTIVAYGDAESHLNIAKRVVDSLTPGFAQLGGIWLPLPHIMMIPFVANDFLWHSGLAGSIVSGICFIISALYIYRLVNELTHDKSAGFFAAIIFMTNPNILYMQTTPMTELPLIAFFILSTYYFIRFIREPGNVLPLILAAFFGFCASLSRYDGWALVLVEAFIIFAIYASQKRWRELQGILIIFCTLALFGIGLWLAWDWLILGDPLYFTHSPFSAKSQQQSWLARGELPAYGDISTSVQYYSYTAMHNIGVVATELAIVGSLLFLLSRKQVHKFYIFLLLMVPFIFNVATLFMGQSIIFIPGLTPDTYQWDLFNVRYGMMMVPFAAVMIGYLMYRLRGTLAKSMIAVGVAIQCAVFALGYAPVLTYADGREGLSSEIAQVSDAQIWLERNYDDGIILLDDFSRTVSLIHTHIPMENVIYIGNKPYWEESLVEPEKYAEWIVMQKNDAIWKELYDKPDLQGRLFKYFNKVYESEDHLLIFRRIQDS